MCACLYNDKKSLLIVNPHASILRDPFLFDKTAYLCLKEYLICLFGTLCLRKARKPMEVRTDMTVVMIELRRVSQRSKNFNVVKLLFLEAKIDVLHGIQSLPRVYIYFDVIFFPCLA